MSPSSLIKYKGYGDILVGLVLTFRPSIIYESGLARFWAGLTGLVSNSASERFLLVFPMRGTRIDQSIISLCSSLS